MLAYLRANYVLVRFLLRCMHFGLRHSLRNIRERPLAFCPAVFGFLDIDYDDCIIYILVNNSPLFFSIKN